MKLKGYRKKKSIWLLSLNSSYADDLARLAYETFILKNIDPNDEDQVFAAKMQEKELKRAKQLEEQLRIEQQI